MGFPFERDSCFDVVTGVCFAGESRIFRFSYIYTLKMAEIHLFDMHTFYKWNNMQTHGRGRGFRVQLDGFYYIYTRNPVLMGQDHILGGW